MTVCLVTGGAGFLGSHLVEALVAANHLVRVIDDFSSGHIANLSRVMDAVELYAGDILDAPFLSKAMRGVDWVFHLAHIPGVREVVIDGKRGFFDDADATMRVLAAAVEAGVRRFLFASSMKVYGELGTGPYTESHPPRPSCSYGRGKLRGELACMIAHSVSGLHTVRLRYFNVFGPRQPPTSPYASTVRESMLALSAQRSPILPGTERSAQDLLFVEDAIYGTLLAASAPRTAGKVYNIAQGRSVTNREIVDSLNEVYGTNIKPIYRAVQGLDNSGSIASVLNAEKDLGFCAALNFRRGIQRYVSICSSSRRDGLFGKTWLPGI